MSTKKRLAIQAADFEHRTFPSIPYEDNPSSYTFCGILPTTTAGVTTCLKYPCAEDLGEPDPFKSDSPVFAYPSHPPIPDKIQNISASYLALDPKGSTWDAIWSFDGAYAELIQPLMPDMWTWNCTPYGTWDVPAFRLEYGVVSHRHIHFHRGR